MAKIGDIQKGGEVIVKKGKLETPVKNAELHNCINKAWELTTGKKATEEQLATVKGFLVGAAGNYLDGGQTITFIAGKVQCKLTFGKEASIPAQNLDRIKALLPDSNIEDLVKRKETFAPEKRLIELADKNPELAELILVKDKAPAFEFSVIK